MIWANLDSMGVNTVHFWWWEREFLPEVQSLILLFFAVMVLWEYVSTYCYPQIISLKWAGSVLTLCPNFLEPNLVSWADKMNLCSKSFCLSWEFWVGKADCCGNKEKRFTREFLFALSLRTCCTVIPSCQKCLIRTSLLVLQSHLCSHWWWLVHAERWQFLCAGSPPEGQCVCGSGTACFSTK